jgi:PKD repeat protein
MKRSSPFRRAGLAGLALAAALSGCHDAQQINAPLESGAADAGGKRAQALLVAPRGPSFSAAGAANAGWEADIGEPYFICDDCSYGVTVDFPFTFYGETLTWWYIGSNGNLSTHNRPTIDDDSFPHRRGDAIAPLAMDWWPDEQGAVHVNTLGEAPNRRFVVTWNNVPPYRFGGGGESRSTFQLQLFEGSNRIQFAYNGLSHLTGQAHAGIGNYDGDRYINAAIGPAAVFALDGTSLCFTPEVDDYTMAAGPCVREQNPQTPTASLVVATAPGERREGSAISFDGSGSANPAGGALTYAWDFGDGHTGSGATPTHVYADDGSYTVTLTVRNATGASHTASTQVAVDNVAPTVSMSLGAQSIVSGQTVTLAGSFGDPGALDGPWGWRIDWGTGTPTTGTAANPAATIDGIQRFCSARSYDVTLRVRDKDEASGSATRTLSVGRRPVGMIAPATLPRNGNGLVTVTVRGAAGFDPASIDLHSVLLSDGSTAGAPIAKRGNGSYHATIEDVDGDGRTDLSLKFNRSQIGVSAATTQLVLLARLDDRCTEIRAVSPATVN